MPSPHLGIGVFTQGVPGTVHDHPGSTWHAAEQPSPSIVFPSSHASDPSILPSPQICTMVETHGLPGVGHV
jgi:hypothetical protein